MELIFLRPLQNELQTNNVRKKKERGRDPDWQLQLSPQEQLSPHLHPEAISVSKQKNILRVLRDG